MSRDEDHVRRAGRILAGAEFLLGRGRQHERGTGAPDDAVDRLPRREEKAWVEVAQPALPAAVDRDWRLRDHGHDPAGDQVPVLAQLDRNDGLDVEDVLGLTVLAGGEIEIVLER